MARYKVVDRSPKFLPVDVDAQLIPGSFAHAVRHVVDALDLSLFDAHYRNDAVGASAHSPAMLLRAVLLAYSQGMISSRAIERACRDTVRLGARAVRTRRPQKAAVALAKKTARRLWAAEHHRTSFDPDHVSVRSTPTSTH